MSILETINAQLDRIFGWGSRKLTTLSDGELLAEWRAGILVVRYPAGFCPANLPPVDFGDLADEEPTRLWRCKRGL